MTGTQVDPYILCSSSSETTSKTLNPSQTSHHLESRSGLKNRIEAVITNHLGSKLPIIHLKRFFQVALLLLLLVGFGTSLLLIRVSQDLRQQASIYGDYWTSKAECESDLGLGSPVCRAMDAAGNFGSISSRGAGELQAECQTNADCVVGICSLGGVCVISQATDAQSSGTRPPAEIRVVAGNDCRTWAGDAVGASSCDLRNNILHACVNGSWVSISTQRGYCDSSFGENQKVNEITYYSQLESKKEIISKAGCGVVTATMIISQTNPDLGPEEMADFYGNSLDYEGTSLQANQAILQIFNYSTEVILQQNDGTPYDPNKLEGRITEAIDNGQTVWVQGNYTVNGRTINHHAVIVGYDKAGGFVFNDPFFGEGNVMWLGQDDRTNGTVYPRGVMIVSAPQTDE